MKYCRFHLNGSAHYGLVESVAGNDDEITRLLLQPPQDSDGDVEGLPSRRMDRIPLAQASLLPPVEPSKIVCVGRNYREHAAELGHEVPQEPLLFFKPPSSLLPPGGTILRPKVSARTDYEGELGVVIARALPPARRRAKTYAPTSSATPASMISPPAICRTKTASGLAPKASTPSARSAPWSPTASRSLGRRPGRNPREWRWSGNPATRAISSSRSTSSSATFRRS